MLNVLQGFVHELRNAGLPVSMTENLDAMRAIEHVDLQDRDTFKAALGATLVKHHHHWQAFETVFDVYFSLHSSGVDGEDELPDWAERLLEASGEDSGGAGGGGELSREELAQMLLEALLSMDRNTLRYLAAMAVTQYAGMEPGRPVGGTYYLYRTLRQLDVDELAARLMGRARERGDVPDNPLGERLFGEELDARVKMLRELIEAEIRRRLVADRGVEAMARTLRKPLPEDVDFMHASRDEMLALQRAIQPLTRLLQARLAARRRHRHRGHLDFRRTIRESLSYGGVPAEPKFRKPHPSKPEIYVVADISGSVASFARFTLQFVYAMASQFSKVRSWVFIDGIDEVTRFFQESDEITEAVHRVNTEADVIWVDGHSDYGHALELYYDRHHLEVTHKTSIMLLGDARNNYHASQAWVVQELNKRARHVYFLNPEPRGYWDTGDSIVSEYGKFCDGVYECRNLRQLERFVEEVAEA
ncbi:MAG: VWA domain-containing protein [Actinobacteria bacterium]|nr:MAG: VWA domain-containing protein [Actinomycetota bacterium]